MSIKKKKKALQKKVEYGNLENKNALIWTRVSTEEQKNNNYSLDNQKHLCNEFAKRSGINIAGYRGETNESGATDRELFNEMVKEVLNRTDVNIVIVAWYDRFSREGLEGIVAKETIRKAGKFVISATEAVDPDTSSGRFMENIMFLMAEMNNQDRKDKFHNGRVGCIRRGDWHEKLPRGFNREKIDKDHIITVNQEGELIRKAFMWKAYENIKDTEILKRLEAQGLKLSKQGLSFIFHNPFYCGKIVHLFNDYEPKKGNQEILIPEEVFNIVNSIKTNNGYIQDKNNPNYFLSNFILCSNCNLHFSGYQREKKSGAIYHYYKCNIKGCQCNTNLNVMHNKFREILHTYSIPDELIPIWNKTLTKVFNEQNKENLKLKTELEKRLIDCETQINDVSLRHGLNKINEKVYNVTVDKLEGDKAILVEELERVKNITSNLSEYVSDSTLICSNIGNLWDKSDSNMKRKIQKLVFPNDIIFDKEIDGYRTQNENKVFGLFRRFSTSWSDTKKTNQNFLSDLSNEVEHTRLELVTFRLPV